MITDCSSCAQIQLESEELSRSRPDRSSLFSVSYSPHAEELSFPGAKTLATLRIFLTQAQQTVSSDPVGAKQYVDRALALIINSTPRKETERAPALNAGGLASWQMLRVKAMIERRLGERLLITELAAAVRLSPSHFARAFKRSLGCSPHHYMLLRRIARAKDQMRTSGAPLAQIALACGFSDQSHFTRSFKSCEGETPTAWHRRTTNRDPRSYAEIVMAVPA